MPHECPECGRRGPAVERMTLKALLTPDGLRRGVPARPRFCATEVCPVVYFDDGVTFIETDLIVPVHAKHPNDPQVPVCYCFGIRVGAMGEPGLRESIAREVQKGHCACEVKNPKGTCCLGDFDRRRNGNSQEVRAIAGIPDA